MSINVNGKPTYVLGTGLSHDGSACLLKNGKICVAIEKERITRRKHDGSNDTAAIQYCLEAEGISIEDLSLVVQNANFGFFEHGNNYYFGHRLFNGKLTVPIVTISHHLAHAYNAIGTMPYHSAAILVMDGCGSSMDECIDLENAIVPEKIHENIKHCYFEKDSFYLYENNKLTTIYKDFSPLGFFLKNYPMHPELVKDSIGQIYSAFSHYIFGDMMDAGKLMGLAPYGKPGIYRDKIFQLKKGRVFVNYDWMKRFKNSPCTPDIFKEKFQYFADIAYWAQKEVEEAIFYIINSRYLLLKNIDSLAYTGGTALNAVANAKILENSQFKNLYLTPAAGDNGLAIGCAYYGWLEILKKPRILHDGNTFLGKVYSTKDIQRNIDTYIVTLNTEHNKIVKELASILPKCLKDNINKENVSHKIQFILDKGSYFGLIFNNEDAKVTFNYIDKPDFIIYSDCMTLINALINKDFYLNALYNKKIIEIGKTNILSEFDYTKIKENFSQLVKYNQIDTTGVKYYYSENICLETAELLASGKVVAWFQDGSEFGPRALGHRSILADPSIASVKDFINLNIKFREDFRPFAPSILLEDVSKYFDFEKESPYMLLVAQARDICKQQCPSVVHADNSSRLQTVTPEWNKKYYQLIKEFKKIKGIPMLLNTSFNKKGMPMIETPMEALIFFYECALDNLVIDNYIIYK